MQAVETQAPDRFTPQPPHSLPINDAIQVKAGGILAEIGRSGSGTTKTRKPVAKHLEKSGCHQDPGCCNGDVEGAWQTGGGAMKMKFFPPFKDEGEVVAAWGEAQLIRYLDGKTELRGGSKEDRLAAQEWISLFWHEAVVGDESGRWFFRFSSQQERTASQ